MAKCLLPYCYKPTTNIFLEMPRCIQQSILIHNFPHMHVNKLGVIVYESSLTRLSRLMPLSLPLHNVFGPLSLDLT